MTALATAVDTKPVASSLVAPCVRRLDDAFSPDLADPMSDDSMGGSGGSSGGCPNNGSGRWKRELEPGGCEEQQPPPAKRASPVPRIPHSPEGTAVTEAASTAAAAQHLSGAAAPVPAPAPAKPAPPPRHWQSSPTGTLNGGIGGAHVHARENALAMSRAKSTSPSKAMAAVAGAAAAAASSATSAVCTRAGRTTAVGVDRPRSPALLSERPALHGEHPPPPQQPPQQQQQHTRPASSLSASPPLTMVGHHHHCRDILKPSPAKQNVGVVGVGGLEYGGAGESGKGGSCKGLKRPLGGGGLRASASWDGGSASSAPPGSGGGFSAPPAVCTSCEVREPCSGGGCGGGGGGGGGGGDGKGATLRPPPSTACLSPLPFARSISAESSGGGGPTGNDLRRHLLGDVDGFSSDTPLSYPFGSLQSSPSLGPQLAVGVRSTSGGGGGSSAGGGGVGAAGHGVDDELAMLMGNDNMHDIQDCMRTLQASPAVSLQLKWFGSSRAFWKRPTHPF